MCVYCSNESAIAILWQLLQIYLQAPFFPQDYLKHSMFLYFLFEGTRITDKNLFLQHNINTRGKGQQVIGFMQSEGLPKN